MSYLPNFLHLIEGNKLISRVITNQSFDHIDFNSLEFRKEWDEHYIFNNIEIEGYIFKSIEIRIVTGNIWINMQTEDLKFFDDPLFFYGDEGIVFEIEPYASESKMIREWRRKISHYTLFNKTARLSILKSDLYGCLIKLGFIN